MKRFVLLLLTTACLTAAYLGGHSQQPAPAQVLSFTKVGVVNLAIIYGKYEHATRLKTSLERDMAPFKEKKEDLERTIAEWSAVGRASFNDDKISPETREMARALILESHRQLEDLEMTTKNELTRKVSQSLLMLEKEVQKALQTYAAAQGYHTILAFGEPETPLSEVAAFKRRMSTVDSGGLFLAHVSGEVDVTMEVLKVLNRQFQDDEEWKGE